YTFDFSAKRAPTAADIRLAIREQAQLALDPPIRNIGVSGIRKAGASVPKWPDTLDAAELSATLFNTYIFINAAGGTGGGIFRYMFSRFLREAAAITGETRLHGPADAFQRIGDEWEQVAAWCKAASGAPDPVAVLAEAPPLFDAVADHEAAAWGELRTLVN
ncbi:MAG: DUF4872 domain-containing protein, partial [Anaerolineae bacterium]|nr:DUF4872 domain-containing protein [Anaerolineae bacterium]